MEKTQYQRIVSDRGNREGNYKEGVKEYYSLATPGYLSGWGTSFHFPPFRAGQTLPEAITTQQHFIAREGNFRPGMRILDAGCGVGGPAIEIAKFSGSSVTGVNLVTTQLEIAREAAEQQEIGDRCSFVEGDIMDLPFEDNYFDAVFSLEAICHTPNKHDAYSEIARVLKPGGTFIGTDWFCADSMDPSEYARLIDPVCRTYMLPYMTSLQELESILKDVGFSVEKSGNVEDLGTMEPVRDILQGFANSEKPSDLPERDEFAFEMLRESFDVTVKAAREKAFLVGYWKSSLR
ncbi:SAM-dependent methyltransferase [Streptomyces sp. NPDC090106]|uniref:SAM-dependent methyltransferase n=1 Tax=Streptomyces sp. NPDC090106 TaxID=3365946 RepID=UPI0037FAEEDC